MKFSAFSLTSLALHSSLPLRPTSGTADLVTTSIVAVELDALATIPMAFEGVPKGPQSVQPQLHKLKQRSPVQDSQQSEKGLQDLAGK